MTKNDILSFSQSKAEPLWLQKRRLTAFEQISTLDLPRIERIKFHRWNLGNGEISESDFIGAVPDFIQLNHNPMLVQMGTQTLLEQLSPELIEKGVVFTDFHTALEEIPDVIENYFGSAINVTEDKLAAYHYAYFNSGAVLYVPDDVEIAVPLEAIFLQDSDSAVPLNKHVLIIAGKNSSFSYIERFKSAGDQTQKVSANISVEIIAGDGCQVRYSAIDQLGKNVTAYISRRAKHGKDSSVDWAMGVMNEGNVIGDFDSDLIGNGSHANLKVVAVSSGRQIQGIDTRVTNYGCHSVGHILQHGVILERGTLTFNGIGHIIKGAKGADAQQESRVLMLSDKARSDANPILLIDENEVTAGHAASIGQIDPEDMYYLMSRGIDRQTAEKLVIRGFLGTVITEIPSQSIRKELIKVLDEKL